VGENRHYQVIKSKKVIFMLVNLALSSYQKRIAKKLNIRPGQEMMQGIESAQAIGANIVLADRRIQTTFMRIWRLLSFWDKCKLFYAFFMQSEEDTDITEADLQDMLQEDMLLAAIKDIRNEFPVIAQVLISERDQYLASQIKNAPGQKIVAILGGAHVPGVKKELFLNQDEEALNFVPPASPVFKALEWLIPILIVALMLFGFFQGFQTGFTQVGTWILWTGSLAALFTALAFGHPLSILTSFLVAPISTLNPVLACGWFTGIVEANLRKPTVEDVHRIQMTFSVLRASLVIAFKDTINCRYSKFGSSLGTFIAGYSLIENLL
jgi:pheromone shutdown-related protein TraB